MTSSVRALRITYNGLEKSKKVNTPLSIIRKMKNTPDVARFTTEERCSPVFIAMAHMLDAVNATNETMATSVLRLSTLVMEYAPHASKADTARATRALIKSIFIVY